MRNKKRIEQLLNIYLTTKYGESPVLTETGPFCIFEPYTFDPFEKTIYSIKGEQIFYKSSKSGEIKILCKDFCEPICRLFDLNELDLYKMLKFWINENLK